jgi:FkbM family methyltransferase
MLTHDEVVWGYRYILGRNPESPTIINSHAKAWKDVLDFRRALLQSKEFAFLFLQFEQPCWVAAPVFGGTRLMWIDLSDRFVSLACLNDLYEPTETRFIREVLRPDDVFVDAGANVGWYTMLASTIIGEGGHIHAFEPRHPVVDYLQRTVALNSLENLITVHSIGLSNEKKSEILMWDPISGNGGNAWLARDGVAPDRESQKIEVQPFDSLNLGRIDIIKMDVEGAEPFLLEGAKGTIDRDRPIIVTEIFPFQLELVAKCSSEYYFDFFGSRHYRGLIVDSVRCGENVFAYPDPWEKPLVNIAFVPEERVVPGSAFGV